MAETEFPAQLIEGTSEVVNRISNYRSPGEIGKRFDHTEVQTDVLGVGHGYKDVEWVVRQEIGEIGSHPKPLGFRPGDFDPTKAFHVCLSHDSVGAVGLEFAEGSLQSLNVLVGPLHFFSGAGERPQRHTGWLTPPTGGQLRQAPLDC